MDRTIGLRAKWHAIYKACAVARVWALSCEKVAFQDATQGDLSGLRDEVSIRIIDQFPQRKKRVGILFDDQVVLF